MEFWNFQVFRNCKMDFRTFDIPFEPFGAPSELIEIEIELNGLVVQCYVFRPSMHEVGDSIPISTNPREVL